MGSQGSSRADLDRAVALIRSLEGERTDEPAGVGPAVRLGALAIDAAVALVLGIAMAAATFVVAAPLWGPPDPDELSDPGLGLQLARLALGALWAGLLVLNGVSGLDRSGRSWGKRAMGLCLVRTDGSPVSLGRRVVRFLIALAAIYGPLQAAGLILVVTDSAVYSGTWLLILDLGLIAALALIVGNGSRGIHDLVCGTRLVAPRPLRMESGVAPEGGGRPSSL